MNNSTRRVLFFLFFLSGFSSLVYQVVWTRMAFASFGIITPVLSVVISVFMLGLAVGSWAGGRLIGSLVERTGFSAANFYAGAEMIIGLGAFVVPKLFAVGEGVLLAAGQTDSFGYLSISALVLAISILPWCLFMGATFPFMMAYVRERERESAESFSFLYLANVLGAMSGTLLTAIVLVETLGFRHTLWVAAAGNFTITIISVWLGRNHRRTASSLRVEEKISPEPAVASGPQSPGTRLIKWILFSTGFSAMSMEVVWTRAFTPVLKTQVYSFAMIVFTYLGATFLGSLLYRDDLRKKRLGNKRLRSTAELISFLAVAAFLPILANDPRFVKADWAPDIDFSSVVLLLASICPLCGVLGYLTPSLIDEYAVGRPADAGKVYAVNVLGCILGPLFASYVLLPRVSERYALVFLSLPFFVFYFLCCKSLSPWRRLRWGLVAVAALALALFYSGDFVSHVSRLEKNTTVRRDYAASVISFGESRSKQLLVNGVGMTMLTPITKFMVHLPLAFHDGKPQTALIICFGMGTTYRSALSWDIDATAVELVPGVRDAFGFYHADAAQVIGNPKGRIIIDDGRRYLKRTREKFDVIVTDPPPPVEAAGSSLLFSKEYYALARQHLNPHGILQAWFPGGNVNTITAQAVFRSVFESFPYVRCFPPVEGWGVHFLASMDPIEVVDARKLAARIPENAKRDLLEWSTSQDLTAYLARVVSREISAGDCLDPDLDVRITDDHPYNEYFLLRRLGLCRR
jgi:spermidine synthase